MPVVIPSSILQTYYDVVDSTFGIFGVPCQLAFVEKVVSISGNYVDIPEIRSVGEHKHPQSQYKVAGQTFEEIETTQDITMKVYWDKKQWMNVGGGNTVLPDADLMTIFMFSSINDVVRAKNLLVHKNIADTFKYRFQKQGEPFPMGIGLKRYAGCFWKRV